MSGIMCHVSRVFLCVFLQSGGASRWRVCYQRGLPRLVSETSGLITMPLLETWLDMLKGFFLYQTGLTFLT